MSSIPESTVSSSTLLFLFLCPVRRDEQRRASSRASIQHLPAAFVGARKIRWEVGRGWTTAPSDSPSGPLLAQMDWSMGWKSLKQKPSFFEGLSISSQDERMIVPIQ